MNGMKDYRNLDRRGLTLTELMITLSIFGVIMAVVMGFVTGARNSYSDTRERAQYQQTMRAVMSMMTRELRTAGCDPTGASFDAFTIADDDVMQCAMDLNGDSDFTDISPDEQVAYVLQVGTGRLFRVAGGQAFMILEGVNDLEFTYFDENGAQLGNMPLIPTDRSLVRHVNIMIDGTTARGEPVSYTTRVALRNG
jgi:prepilin-type N-terminal cleavage/methylation domain-containing protein